MLSPVRQEEPQAFKSSERYFAVADRLRAVSADRCASLATTRQHPPAETRPCRLPNWTTPGPQLPLPEGASTERRRRRVRRTTGLAVRGTDRKSTRLNSS